LALRAIGCTTTDQAATHDKIPKKGPAMTTGTLLRSLTVRTIAIREVLVVLLARAAKDTANSAEALRQISNGLHKHIDEHDSDFMTRVPLEFVEDIRVELDQIFASAQKILNPRAAE
jgi:hypothetical protein